MTEQTQETTVETAQQPAQACVLLPYTKPQLTTYGAVRDLTLGTGSVSGDSGVLSMATGSDPALKENIVRIGTHPLGFGLYLFDYKPEFHHFCPAGRQFGVMADEVEAIRPDAVGSSHGFRTVDYGKLGIVRTLQ
jgi:hypothetical protein